MKEKNYAIISFEGLDCSFKETNYNSFTSKLEKEISKNVVIHKESFPRYGNWSAMAVERWLNGSFDREMLKAHPKAVDSMYCIDRFAYWYEMNNDGNRRIDLLSDADFHYFVFDRYTLSNAIYNPIHTDAVDIEDFNFDNANYGIPNADITIWMRMNNFDVLSELIAQKKNKDANELDIEFLRGIWERSEKIINSNIFDSIGTRLIVVDCLNNDGTIKERDTISNYIWSSVSKII